MRSKDAEENNFVFPPSKCSLVFLRNMFGPLQRSVCCVIERRLLIDGGILLRFSIFFFSPLLTRYRNNKNIATLVLFFFSPSLQCDVRRNRAMVQMFYNIFPLYTRQKRSEYPCGNIIIWIIIFQSEPYIVVIRFVFVFIYIYSTCVYTSSLLEVVAKENIEYS